MGRCPIPSGVEGFSFSGIFFQWRGGDYLAGMSVITGVDLMRFKQYQ